MGQSVAEVALGLALGALRQIPQWHGRMAAGEPLRGRANVVHTPHIAGRTRDANLRVADVIADDFARVLRGEPLQAALTLEAMRVRTIALPVLGAEGPL